MKDDIFEIINNGGVPMRMFNRTLNSVQFMIGVTLFRPGQRQKEMRALQGSSFKSLRIVNSLDCWFPSFTLDFVDWNGIYSHIMKQKGEYVRIVVQQQNSTETDQSHPLRLDLYFLVQKHQIKSIDTKYVRYELSGRLWTARNFGFHVPMATQINQLENNRVSPYKLIQRVLSKINYPIKNQLIPPTDNSIYYISDQNFTVGDMVQYFLLLGCTILSPPTYLYHHMMSNQPVLLNNKWNKLEEDLAANKNIQIQAGGGMTTDKKDLLAKVLQMEQNSDTSQHMQDRSTEIFWNFDQIGRKWTRRVYLPERIDRLLTYNTDEYKTVKSVFYRQSAADCGVEYHRANWEYDFYYRMKNLDLSSNNVVFIIQGNILRDAGQVLQVNMSLPNLRNLFSGKWQIYQVQHVFKGQSYINQLTCFRNYNMNYQIDDQTQQAKS